MTLSLVAPVNAARCLCFVHNNLADAWTLRFQFLPEPFCHVFNRRVFQSFDVVKILVVQHFQQRFHRVADLGVVVNPTCLGIDVAFDRNLDLETVTMQPAAFVSFRHVGQSLRRFETELFGQSSAHRSDPTLRRAPDEFVHLKLKPDIKFISQNPFNDLARIDSSEDRREEHGMTAGWKNVTLHLIA